MVAFYAPWCNHCRQLWPEFERAAELLQGRATLAWVDATVEVLLAEQYRVDAYPVIYLFKDGRPDEYTGARQNATLVQWFEENAGPPVRILPNPSAAQDLVRRRQLAPIFLAQGQEKLKQVFALVAEEYRGLGTFAFYAGRSESVQVHRGLQEAVELRGADVLDVEKLRQFIWREHIPLYGEVGEDNYEAYAKSGMQGLLWLCFHPDSYREDAARHMELFREVASEFMQIPVVYTNTKLYLEHVEEELGCSTFPSAVLQLGNFSSEEEELRRYRFPKESPGDFQLEALAAWLRAALDGKAPTSPVPPDGAPSSDEHKSAGGASLAAAAEGAAAAGGGGGGPPPPEEPAGVADG